MSDDGNKRDRSELRQLQMLPLDIKIKKTQQRIREWVEHFGEDGVYVSFSGGKDSTVLLDIARQMYPDILAVFFDTGLEFPEIRDFVRRFDNVEWIKPKKTFKEIVMQYGYPLISKEISFVEYYAKKYFIKLYERYLTLGGISQSESLLILMN